MIKIKLQAKSKISSLNAKMEEMQDQDDRVSCYVISLHE